MENLILVVAIVAIATLERWPRTRRTARPFFRSFFRDDVACFATGVVALGLGMRAAARSTGVELSAADLGAWPLPATALVAIVLYDVGGWSAHALMHRFDRLWRFHRVHHSSLELDWLAAFRAHFVEHALRHFFSAVPLVLLGFPPVAIGIAGAVYASWAALDHSNLRLRLGWLEWLLVTPRLHRLHHVPATSEKNLGTIFTIWDRLAGRLVSDPAAPLSPLGVPGDRERYPQTWLAFTLEPFRGSSVSSPTPAVPSKPLLPLAG